jgi:hypothetical protein
MRKLATSRFSNTKSQDMPMDFKKVTDALMECITTDDLAKALGVSVSLVRQARVRDGALCHRNPPKNWEPVVLQLAKQKAEYFTRLAERLSDETYTRSRPSRRPHDLAVKL